MSRAALLPLAAALAHAGCGVGAAEQAASTSPVTGRAAVVAIPPTIGLPVAIAASRLRAAGLRVAVSPVDSPLADGSVLRQLPAPGRWVRRGTTVRLTVSRQVSDARPNQVVVPSVTGLRRATAVLELEAAELRARVVRVQARASAGTVVAQQPPPGTRLLRSSVVTLRVSR